MSSTKNVKILTWLQLCTVVVVILAAWFYVRPQQPASAATGGIIDGILFSRDNPSVLIDGQVLRAGDTIYGVEVVEIGKRIVTFEKNNKRWKQRVQERPNRAWDEPDPSESDANDLSTRAASPKGPAASKQTGPIVSNSLADFDVGPPMPYTCPWMPTENTGLSV